MLPQPQVIARQLLSKQDFQLAFLLFQPIELNEFAIWRKR